VTDACLEVNEKRKEKYVEKNHKIDRNKMKTKYKRFHCFILVNMLISRDTMRDAINIKYIFSEI
jgi:hypothetical protein